MHQPVPGVDDGRAGGSGEAGPADLGDGIALDQDVRRRRLALGDVQKLAAADDGIGTFGFCGHAPVSQQSVIAATAKSCILGRDHHRCGRMP
jgi:hypothetical protein